VRAMHSGLIMIECMHDPAIHAYGDGQTAGRPARASETTAAGAAAAGAGARQWWHIHCSLQAGPASARATTMDGWTIYTPAHVRRHRDPIHCRRPCREGTYTYYTIGSVQHESAVSTTTPGWIRWIHAALVYGRCLPMR